MKTYQIKTYGDLSGLQMTERETPTPGPGEVLIRVRACALNFRDLIVLRGTYAPSPLPDLIPLSDGAGDVVSVGEGVTRIAAGQRVASLFFQTWMDGPISQKVHDSALGGAINGVLSEYIVLKENGVVPIPDYMTYEEAACLPCAGVTVWNALFERGNVRPGETVLLLGTGGVSIFSLQLAKDAGARVIITSSSDEKLERARLLGADETINYKTFPDWQGLVWEKTGKRGADHVVEVGGAGTLEKSFASARVGGHVALIGVLSGRGGMINPSPILYKSLRLSGIYVGSRAMFERLLKTMAQNFIRPVVDKVFAFDEAKAAYEYLQSGSHFGKVVVGI